MLRVPNSLRRMPSFTLSAGMRSMNSRTSAYVGLGMRKAKNGHNDRLRYSRSVAGKSTIGLTVFCLRNSSEYVNTHSPFSRLKTPTKSELRVNLKAGSMFQ